MTQNHCLKSFWAPNNFGHLAKSFQWLPHRPFQKPNLSFSIIYLGINTFMILILFTWMPYWCSISISHFSFLDWKTHEGKDIYSVPHYFLHSYDQEQLLNKLPGIRQKHFFSQLLFYLTSNEGFIKPPSPSKSFLWSLTRFFPPACTRDLRDPFHPPYESASINFI